MSNNDEKIKELMKVVESKRNSIGKKPKTTWKTNGIFIYDTNRLNAVLGRRLNLNNVYNKNDLVEALAYLLNRSLVISEASKILGMDNSTFTHSNYQLEDWVSDFKLRISQIDWENEKRKLDNLEKQLESLISEDVRTEMVLEKIESIIDK